VANSPKVCIMRGGTRFSQRTSNRMLQGELLCLFLAYQLSIPVLIPPVKMYSMKIDSFELFLWKESHAKARIVLSHKTIKRPGELAPASRSLTAQDPPSVLTPKSKKLRTGKRDVPFATKEYPGLQTRRLVELPNCWYNTFPSRT
jgi:hypothetical protein